MLRARGRLAAAAAVVIALAAGLAGGVFVDQEFPGQVPTLLPGAPSGHLDRASFAQAVRIIEAHYYSSKIDYGKLTDGSIQGLVGALGDPFSRYLSPDQYRRQLQNYAGQLTGIGIYVDLRGQYPRVSAVIPGGPADRAGLRAGDLIVAVDGRTMLGRKDQLSSRVEGRAGTTVKLTIRRGSAEIEVPVTRAKITVPSVAAWHFGDLLYLRVYAFQDSTAKEFASQLKAGLPARGIVLDLRDNPGGFIDAAQAMVSQFFTGGEVFSLRDRSGAVSRRDVSGPHLAASVPLVVLGNANTASAAEITAGALQSRGRAKLVGGRTFGKGEVEEDFPLQGGGDLHLTVEHWFLPDGRSVQGKGLKPDIVVPLARPQDMFNVIEPALGHAADAQLNRALALLGGG